MESWDVKGRSHRVVCNVAITLSESFAIFLVARGIL